MNPLKYHLLLWLILITLAYTAVAEESSTIGSQWNFSLGYEHQRMLDQNTSPLVYGANSLLLDVGYRKTTPKYLWSLTLDTAVGSNQSVRFGQRVFEMTDPDTLTGPGETFSLDVNPWLSYMNAGLKFSWLWRLTSGKHKFYLGPELSERFSYAGMGADTWFLNQLSLGPEAFYEYSPGPSSRIEIVLNFPIITWIVRQPYTLDPSLPVDSYFTAYIITGSELVSLGSFQQVDLTVRYTWLMKNGHSLGGTYRFRWSNLGNISDRNFRQYSNSIAIIYRYEP